MPAQPTSGTAASAPAPGGLDPSQQLPSILTRMPRELLNETLSFVGSRSYLRDIVVRKFYGEWVIKPSGNWGCQVSTNTVGFVRGEITRRVPNAGSALLFDGMSTVIKFLRHVIQHDANDDLKNGIPLDELSITLAFAVGLKDYAAIEMGHLPENLNPEEEENYWNEFADHLEFLQSMIGKISIPE